MLEWIARSVAFAARRYRLPASERDEIHQDICLRIVKAIRGFDPHDERASLETWVRQHATWEVADYWRRRLDREGHETPTGEPGRLAVAIATPQAAAEGSELRAGLERCLERLTQAQRDRFLAAERSLGRRRGLKEIAASFGISRDTLKETVARARVLLRRCLSASGFSPHRDVSDPPEAGEGAE